MSDHLPTVGDKKVFLHGSIISHADEPVELKYEQVSLIIDWDYSESNQADTKYYAISNNKIKYVLYNCTNQTGVSYELPAGAFDGEPVVLRLFIHTITPILSKLGSLPFGDVIKSNRLINYTLCLSRGENK